MFHSRRSREERRVDSGALAAATAIGKVLKENGTSLDVSKLPKKNNITRTYSINIKNSRRNSLIIPRKNSLREHDVISRNLRRTSSLLSNKKNHNNDILVEAEDIFHDFGGVPASGVEKNTNFMSNMHMITKYVPSIHGLVAIQVPIEEPLPNNFRKYGTERSSSMHSGLKIHRYSLKSKSSNQSLNSNGITSQVQHANKPNQQNFKSKQHGQSKQTDLSVAMKIEENKPIIEQSLIEETEQQLAKDSIINSKVVSDIQQSTIVPSCMDDTNKVDLNTVEEKKIDKFLDHAIELKEKPSYIEQKKIFKNLNEVVKPEEEILQVSDVEIDKLDNSTDFHKNEIVEPIELKLEPEIQTGSHIPESCDNLHINLNEKSDSIVKETTLNAQQNCVVDNSINDDLSFEGALPQKIEATLTDTSCTNVNESCPLKQSAKSSSVIKSAMKKTTNNISHNNDTRSKQSSATDAYLSLTTAENTRRNAQLSLENLTRKPSIKRVSRPQSAIITSTVTSPKKAGIRTKNQSTHTNHMGNTYFKRNNSGSHLIQTPEKRSSFEKQRPPQNNLGFKYLSLRDDLNVDYMHDQSAMKNGFHGHLPHSQIKHTQQEDIGKEGIDSKLSIIGGENWKSRFHDSDSDEEHGLLKNNVPNHMSASGFQLFQKPKPSIPSQSALHGSQPVNTINSLPQSKAAPMTPKSNHRISNLKLRYPSADDITMPMVTKNKCNEKLFPGIEVPSGQLTTPEKKKNNLGGKLKKLFGRKNRY